MLGHAVSTTLIHRLFRRTAAVVLGVTGLLLAAGTALVAYFHFAPNDAFGLRLAAVLLAAGVVVAALGFALVYLHRHFEALLGAPLAALATAVERCEPVPRPHNPAFAELIDGFNEVLDHWQQREAHHAQRCRLLEEQLEQRTAELRATGARLRIETNKRKRAQAELTKLSSALTHAADAVMVTNREGIIEYVNPAFENITGYAREAAIGARPNILKSGRHEPEFYAAMWQTILRGEVFRDVVLNRRADGSFYHEEKTITPLKDSRGEITHFISTGKDISERIRVQEKLEFMAHHDAVTGLPNRVLLMDRIEQAILRARRDGDTVAVLFLDLDGFKAINDTVGHHVGDRFLSEVAARLSSSVRERDTVARLGGDEFALVLEGMNSMNALSTVARKILRDLAAPFVVDGRDLYVTGSIGIARFPRDGEDVHTLLRKADSAMYRAKQVGKNTYRFYSQLEGDEDVQRLEMEQHLRRAVERGEFVIYYQPQVSIDTGMVAGVEALLRWHNPDHGLIEPSRFISVLEETGLIVDVGDWVLRQACLQARRWREEGLPLVRIAVNLSSRQFTKRDLVGSIARILDETGHDPRKLHLEITEGTLASKFETTVATLQKLAALGVSISIDDFGVGYSSLNYLKRLPIHALKIDQSFVRDVTSDKNDAAIARTIIALAHNLGLDVIAEGVETLEQLFFLSRQGCHEVQGHLLCEPLPPDAFARWYRANPRVRARRVASA
ncbi:MAG TPA: EAL domain-containing protein [Gammaproteobacteria bacterium]|nr:EAL domain-containing protein [Gammaproteobacteria bacterium]